MSTTTQPPDYGPPISLADAKRVVAAAEAESIRLGFKMVIAIVDQAGRLVCLHRMDNAQFGSIEVAPAKALSAVAFRRPTKMYQDTLADTPRALALPMAMPVEGGLPLLRDGKIIGGIGVSGAKSDEDGVVAAAGAKALT